MNNKEKEEKIASLYKEINLLIESSEGNRKARLKGMQWEIDSVRARNKHNPEKVLNHIRSEIYKKLNHMQDVLRNPQKYLIKDKASVVDITSNTKD